MANRSQNINNNSRVEALLMRARGTATTTATTTPMARFSIGDSDEETHVTRRTPKRPRFGEATSQSQTQPHSQSQPQSQSQSQPQQQQLRRVLAPVEVQEELVSIQELDSDSQGFEEEEEEEELEEEEEEEEEDGEDIGSEDDDDDDDDDEEEEAAEGQNEQQVTGASTALTASQSGQGFVSFSAGALRSCSTATAVCSSGAMTVMLTDPDVLDCPICLDPLCTPIFQCDNGHIACSSCCSKVKRKCPSCCLPIGYNRCRAIEKVIESVRVTCRNMGFGCKEMMTYGKKSEHELVCPHSACFCPHSECDFTGSSKTMYLHFGTHHPASATRFTYDSTFSVPMEKSQKVAILQEQHESIIFILNHAVQGDVRVFNLDCIGPSMLKSAFVYQLTVKCKETSLSMQSVPETFAKRREHPPLKKYLTVPSDFCGCTGRLCLQFWTFGPEPGPTIRAHIGGIWPPITYDVTKETRARSLNF